MWRVALVLLCVQWVVSSPPYTIKVDGDFEDWSVVSKRRDPSRAREGEASPEDGFPRVWDVHALYESQDGCAWRAALYNPGVDIMETAMVHDDNSLYVYAKTMGDMRRNATRVTLYLDLDNNVETGYCNGVAGTFPSLCGIDMSVRVRVLNDNSTHRRITLHSMRNETEVQYAKQRIQTDGKVVFGRGENHLYLEYAYWQPSSPPSAIDRRYCDVFALPGGAMACFSGDGDEGPRGGATLVKFDVTGQQVEMSIPLPAFLLDGSGQTLSLQQTLVAQLSVESNDDTDPASSDATGPFAYELSPGEVRVSLEAAIVIPCATFILGVVGTSIIACLIHMKKNRSGYTDIQ